MSSAVAESSVSVQQARGRRSSLTRSRVRAAWLFIAPSLIVLALIAGWPLARTIWFSFTDADLNNLSDYQFIGFENYLANFDGEWLGLLTEPDWWRSVWNTVWFTLGPACAVLVTSRLSLGATFGAQVLTLTRWSRTTRTTSWPASPGDRE